MLYYYSLMKKYILLFIAMFFVTSCANLEFVYKNSRHVNDLKNNTNLFINGDESDDIYIYIIGILESANSNNPNYTLSINSKRIEEALVVEKDATASKFSIEYTIKYSLYNINKNCKIIEVINITKDFYDSKSAGYSFGTDLSKKETNTKIISKNIDRFISSIDRYGELNNCSSEN